MSHRLPAGFVSALERAAGPGYVRDDDAACEAVSRDETPNGVAARPDVVVRPRTTEEVAAVMRSCHEAGVPLTVRGGGSGKAGGCVPVAGGVVLSTDRMRELREVSDEDLLLVAQPGVILKDVHEAAEGRGLFYPPDPASLDWATLGGTVATNAGGPRALKYGVTGDYILGVEAVLPTGEVVRTGRRTVKGVTGYDLTSLLVGSEGTLAILTEVTVRLVGAPRAVQTALISLPSAEAAARCVQRVLLAGVVPRTLEYVDAASIRAARAHVGEGSPFPEDAGAALIVEADGDTDDLALAQVARVVEIAEGLGARDTRVATDARKRREIWDARRVLSDAVRKLKPRKVSEDVVVPRSRLPELVARVGALGERHDLLTCAYGHAGDGNLHVQVLFDDDEDLPRVDRLLEDLFVATLELGGTLSGEHGIGLSKKRFLPLEQSEATIDLQRRVKAAFDPKGVLNPGKMLPARAALRAAAAGA